MLKDILKKIYAAKEDAANDWSMITDPNTNQTLYLNKAKALNAR